MFYVSTIELQANLLKHRDERRRIITDIKEYCRIALEQEKEDDRVNDGYLNAILREQGIPREEWDRKKKIWEE